MFYAKRIESGIVSRYFFSSRLLREEANRGPENHSYVHLSLGEQLSDWHKDTDHFSRELYGTLLQSSKPFFSPSLKSTSDRQAEVLVGSLIILIARRIARSKSQIEKLGDPREFSHLSAKAPQILDLKIPRSTAESYKLLQSPEFSDFIDYLAFARHFGLPGAICVKMTTRGRQNGPQTLEKRRNVAIWAHLATQKMIAVASSRNTISIVSTYLGRWPEVLLSLLLGQTPSLLEVRPVLKMDSGHSTREFVLEGSDPTKNTAEVILKILMPWSLVEGFEATLQRAISLGFARNPRVIFTSNGFDTDDEFKVHLAKALPRAAYVVGQHGNEFGVSKVKDLCPELRASDLFLSWGWGGDEQGVHPFGQIKPALRVRKPIKVRGVTLFLRDELDLFLLADMHEINNRYFRNIEGLCASLNDLQVTTHLRLHTSTSLCTRNFLEKAVEKMPFVAISGDRPSMRKLLASGMGVVFGYDSTGMLEMGTAGIPFFLFAPDGLGLVRREFRANYDSLRCAGLLSEDPAQAAQLISTWISASRVERKTQREAIQNFTKGIAHSPKNKLRALRKILKNADEYVAHTRLKQKVENID